MFSSQLFGISKAIISANSMDYLNSSKYTTMPTLRLINLQCILNDESDLDEVYLKHDGEKVWPESSKYERIDNDSTVEVNTDLEVKADSTVTIELWDYDLLSRNDHLGDFTMKVDQFSGGPYSAQLRRKETKSSASYILNWQVIE